MRGRFGRITMLSSRVPADEAAETQRWADRLGVDLSELLRSALRRHLVGLAAEQDAARWKSTPLREAGVSLAEAADWGPVSELPPTGEGDGVPTDCVVNFDNLHTLPCEAFRRRVAVTAVLSPGRLGAACRALADAAGC